MSSDLDDDQDDTDYCMTSPHSKSTIASTSSHYTAPAAQPVPMNTTTTTTNTTTTTSNTETKKGGKSGNGSNGMKKCLYCGSKSTPMWRRGPQGAGTLCNACGVKWKHGKILCGNDAPNQSSTTLVSPSSTQAKESHPRRNSGKGDKRRRKTSSATIKKDKTRNKAAQQRKRASIQQKMESDEDDMMTGVQYTFTSPRDIVPESFHPRYQQQRIWEHGSSVSSYSHSFEESSCSPPLESFSSSPNSSIHDPMMDKNSSSSSSSSFPLSDAVEAATVLTLLKRS